MAVKQTSSWMICPFTAAHFETRTKYVDTHRVVHVQGVLDISFPLGVGKKMSMQGSWSWLPSYWDIVIRKFIKISNEAHKTDVSYQYNK